MYGAKLLRAAVDKLRFYAAGRGAKRLCIIGRYFVSSYDTHEGHPKSWAMHKLRF